MTVMKFYMEADVGNMHVLNWTEPIVCLFVCLVLNDASTLVGH